MSQVSKYYGIKFPVFGLFSVPFDLKIKLDSIEIQKQEFCDWYCIDRYVENKSLLERYILTKDDNFVFDVTCTNLSQLISKKVKWAIDSNFKIYNLSAKQTFKARNVKVRKCIKNIIWVDSVSYPFKLKKGITDPKEILNQYITIVYIDTVWILYRFSSFKEQIESVTL
jgi:hypothetical protein